MRVPNAMVDLFSVSQWSRIVYSFPKQGTQKGFLGHDRRTSTNSRALYSLSIDPTSSDLQFSTRQGARADATPTHDTTQRARCVPRMPVIEHPRGWTESIPRVSFHDAVAGPAGVLLLGCDSRHDPLPKHHTYRLQEHANGISLFLQMICIRLLASSSAKHADESTNMWSVSMLQCGSRWQAVRFGVLGNQASHRRAPS